MELVSRAMEFAIQVHDGMRRKTSDIPYILHPMEAAAIVGSLTADQEVIAAAVLHDVVEDTPTTIEEVEANFGARVAELVAAETEDKRAEMPPEASWRIRKEEAIDILRHTNDMDVKRIFLGDKLANMRAIYQQWEKSGNAMWKDFHQKNPAQHGWYYRAIAEAVRELDDSLAWKEYNELVRTVFEEGEKP